MFTTKKIAIVSVINDIVTDNRVNRTCLTLRECGFDVLVVGRKLPHSLPLPAWPFKSRRMKLLFKTGPAFYLFFNLRLFFVLLFKKASLLYANDLDTLLPNFIVSRIKSIPIIYDSHELFCEVPELKRSALKRKAWLMLERWVVPKLKHCITVNNSIAKELSSKYRVIFNVIRNIPDTPLNFQPQSRSALGLPVNRKIVLMQGAGINIDRGAEELADAMEYTEDILLLVIGGGDVWPLLKEKINLKKMNDKVWLIDKMPKEQLLHYTHNADLGLSIDKNTNLNYYYSLPNKLFDYLQAMVPVLASRLPEIENIITAYGVGDFINDHQPATIAAKLKEMLNEEKLKAYRQNMKKLNEELNWKNEKPKLAQIINEASTTLAT